MWGFGNMGGLGYGFGFGGIMMILFWGLIIWAVLALVRGGAGGGCCGIGHGGGHGQGGNKENKALDILKERYAKGELTKDEFEKMKNDLA